MYKAIKGDKKKASPKERPQKETRDLYEDNRVNSDAIIATAGDIDHINEPTPVLVQPQQSTFEKANDLSDRGDFYSHQDSIYSGSSNFVPAMYSKFLVKPTSEKIVHTESAPVQSAPQPMVNEQMSLDFDARQELNEQLVTAKPEFVQPSPVMPAPAPMPRPAPVQVEQPRVEQVERKPIKWVPPSTALLENLEVQGALDLNNSVAEERMIAINEVFENFHVGARCISYVVGPSVTRYTWLYSPRLRFYSPRLRR